jgi:hypothetical protein
VFANLKIGSAFVALVCIAVAPNASAVTAEVAKKCNALTAKAYPPRVVGNPAAGSAKGTGNPNGTILTNAWPMGATWTIPPARKQSD